MKNKTDIRKSLKNYVPLLLITLSLGANMELLAQNEVIPVWTKSIPGAIKVNSFIENVEYKDAIPNSISKVNTPTLSVFLPDKNKSNGTAVIICPGGGYSHLAIDKEGYKIAQWLNSLGVAAFVLKYRLPNDEIMENKIIGPLQDAQESIRLIRRNAEKWNIEPSKIGIMGFSAGGHLAATLSTHYEDKVYSVADNVSARPDFSILIYPVISMSDSITHLGSRNNLLGRSPSPFLIEKYSNEKQVNSQTPPAFLVHAADDHSVPVENSLDYFKALKKNDIPVELHIYEKGGHGFGMGNKVTNQNWPKTLEKWMLQSNYLTKKTTLVFSYFKENGEDGLHLAYSENGYDWKALNDNESFLKPELGNEKLMRDPCIIKGGDDKYHMVWTVGWTEKGIGYASSEDLIHWSNQKFIPVMEHEKDAQNTWAPEITYDANNNEYMIYWATTIKGAFPDTQIMAEKAYNHRIYYTITKNFNDFSPTQLLYEPGFNVIDASIQKKGEKYIMFLKDETREPEQKNIKVAYSNSLTGPYSKASEPITGNYWAEGPTSTIINGEWWVYFDKYTQKKYGAVRSPDLKIWTDISDQINFPEGTRHGSVLRIPSEILAKLKKY